MPPVLPAPLTPDAIADRLDATGVDGVLAAAARDGMLGLLAAAGAPLHSRLADLRRRLELEEALRYRELRAVTAALLDAGLSPVLLKGSALAYTHYDAPWHRPRADLDLLVEPGARAAAGAALARLGYAPGDLVDAPLLMRQDLWERRLTPGAAQMVDVHVDVSNRARMAACLPAAVLLARAVPAPFAGVGVRQLDPIDAILLTAAHRVAHHSRDRRRIWSLDLHRQAARLAADEVAQLRVRAVASGLASVVAHELAHARADWGEGAGALAVEVIEALAQEGRHEPARAFLAEGRGRAGDLWLDLSALPRWRDRARLIGEHLLPVPAHMARLGYSGPRSWQYARRIARGAVRFLVH